MDTRTKEYVIHKIKASPIIFETLYFYNSVWTIATGFKMTNYSSTIDDIKKCEKELMNLCRLADSISSAHFYMKCELYLKAIQQSIDKINEISDEIDHKFFNTRVKRQINFIHRPHLP